MDFEEKEKIAKWSLYFRLIAEQNGISQITPTTLIGIALSIPAGQQLYSTQEEAMEYANKTIDHIKTHEDYFFDYDEEKDLIYKKDIEELN